MQVLFWFCDMFVLTFYVFFLGIPLIFPLEAMLFNSYGFYNNGKFKTHNLFSSFSDVKIEKLNKKGRTYLIIMTILYLMTGILIATWWAWAIGIGIYFYKQSKGMVKDSNN